MEPLSNPQGFSKDILLNIYHKLLRPRVIEEKMLILLRQGKLGKWFSGIGQEALSVGAALAMQDDEFILPMHRNLGVFTSRNIPLSRLIMQFQAGPMGFTKGRDRSFHFGSLDHKIVGMISHLGPQLAIADGIALAGILNQEKKATLVFTGEGATSEGDFHEALNIASVWKLPVIFLVENNGYALSTPTSEQYNCRALIDKGIGFGMESYSIDGNNILEVFQTLSSLAFSIRTRPRPILVEGLTFRMRGHEEASDTKYIPKEIIDEWAQRDPILQFEKYLISLGYLSVEESENIRNGFKQEVDQAVEEASLSPRIQADPEKELDDVYAKAPFTQIEKNSNYEKYNSLKSTQGIGPEIRYLESIRQGIDQAMEKYPELIFMGQDIAEYGGAFKLSEGLFEKFGKARVRNTPLCESGILGLGLGLSIKAYKSIIEMQFADFVSMGFNQIVNNLAKIHYRWGQNADMVIRMPTGAGTAAGPFHSQSNEAWFIKTPGLKVVYPAFPFDAKGLFLASVEDPNPILFFEHKYLYRSLSGPVPQEYYTLPIGKANILVEGTDLSIISYGMGVHWALDCLKENPQIQAELIDLRSLQPWDKDLVRKSVQKTGKALILHEDTLTLGFGAEISAYLAENCFADLDAPIMRCASLDTPVPANAVLEEVFLAKKRLQETLIRLWNY